MGDGDRVDNSSEREYPGGRGRSRGDLMVEEEVGTGGRKEHGDNVVVVEVAKWRGEKSREEGEEEGVGGGGLGEDDNSGRDGVGGRGVGGRLEGGGWTSAEI